MLTQQDANHRSALATYCRSHWDTGTADWAHKFPFPRARKIELIAWGVTVATFTGTSVACELRVRTSGLQGNPGNLRAYVSAGVQDIATVTLTSAVSRWYRVAPPNAYYRPPSNNDIAQGAEGDNSNGFDDETNVYFEVSFDKTSMTAWKAYAWAKARIYYDEDQIGTIQK
jgi:hypothetical protein